MALLTDDQDIREVYLHTEYGGNGDYYINLTEGDNRINFRVATSGGNAPTNVKLAIASLFRIMEDAGLNERLNPTALENKQTGEPCFTDNDLIKIRFSHIDSPEETIRYVNQKASQYATDRAKKALEEKDEMVNAVYEGAELWKQEYDDCRKILIELCALKKEKDSLGKTDHYLENQPEAWKKAFEFITKYQHHVE